MPPVAECLVGAELDEARHGTDACATASTRQLVSRGASSHTSMYGKNFKPGFKITAPPAASMTWPWPYKLSGAFLQQPPCCAALAIWAGTCDPEAARTAAPPDRMRVVPVELNSNGAGPLGPAPFQ